MDNVNPDGMADNLTLQPTLSQDALDKLGAKLKDVFTRFERDRRQIEITWAKNYRQYKGIYDQDVIIGPDQSKAYPKLTRVKVLGMVSRLMDMLFPQTEKNWGLQPSPVPDISQQDLQQVLDQLQQGGNTQLTSDQIEAAVVQLVKARCDNMDNTIQDQLFEMEYEQLVRKVVKAGVLYSCGVLKGPMNTSVKTRKWVQDPMTGRYNAVETVGLRPVFEFVPIWDYYPDLTAKTWQTMEGEFQRHVLDSHSFLDLAARPDFMAPQVRAYLREHPEGNWQEKTYEQELRMDSADRLNIQVAGAKKFEVYEWWGRLSGKTLRDVGVAVKDNELELEIEANIWIVDDTVIKAAINPFRGKVQLFHQFVFEDDDASLMGEGLPPVMRDSQMAACASARMLLDNGSVVCGPILEMNQDLLMPGQSLNPHARKVYMREGIGAEAAQPAVREVRVDSHLNELMAIFNMFKGLADEETILPPQALGNVAQAGSGKEAYRTAQGTSMLLGAASLPIRDTVRNFDKFTISVIDSLVHWNTMFNTDPEIKGDFKPIARGSTSLMAKEVRAGALDQLAVTLTPEDRQLIYPRELLKERLTVRDLPLDILKPQEVIDQESAQAQQAQAQNDQFNKLMQTLQAKLLENQVAETGARADRTTAQTNLATAQANHVGAQATKTTADANAVDTGTKMNVIRLAHEVMNGGDQTGSATSGS